MNGGQRMNRTAERKITVLILILMLILPSAATAAVPLPVTLLTGETNEPLRIVLSEPEVKKLSQFDENRTEQLNRLIRHAGIDLNIDSDCSRTRILIDNEEAFSYLQNDDAERIYSFEPTVLYQEKTKAGETDDDDFTLFLEQILVRANRYMNEFYTLFSAAPETFAERTRKEGTELRLSGFGKAVQRVTIPFPADYVKENFPKALIDLTDSEECRKIISGLTFSGAQKISLLYDAEGRIVRINYDGTVGESEETLRKVSLVWKVLREEEHQKDSISLKTPAVKGADKDNIALERDLDSTDSALGQYTWDIQIDHRAGKEDKKQTHFSAQITNADSVISGNMEYSIKRDGKNPKTKVLLEIGEENEGEYKGTIEIADYSGKIEKNRILVHALLQKGETLKWPEAGFTKTGTAEGNENEPQIEPEDTIAGIIIQKLFELPEEDLTYFSNEIPASMWLESVH